MSGVMQSEYLVSREAWDAFLARLQETSLHIEQKGDLKSGFFIDVKSRKEGAHGVWLATWPYRTVEDTGDIKIEMHWVVKNAGIDPNASKNVATQIEDILIGGGAKCFQSPLNAK